MKLDGSLQAIYEKWFGAQPDPLSSTMAVYVGYGAPGFTGYDPTPHVPQCQ
jgi:polar amino acid transport system substrate-binding protein